MPPITDVEAFAGHAVVSERAQGLERIRIVDLHDRRSARHRAARARLRHRRRVQRRVRHRRVPVHLHLAGVAAVDRRLRGRHAAGGRSSRRSPCSAATTRPRTAPSGCGRPPPTGRGCRSRSSPGQTSRSTAALRACCTATARTRSRSIPTFSAARLNLLERGFVFAIAHIRGGGELGRTWYEQGRLEHKRNTFTDFIACAEHLIAAG